MLTLGGVGDGVGGGVLGVGNTTVPCDGTVRYEVISPAVVSVRASAVATIAMRLKDAFFITIWLCPSLSSLSMKY